MENHKSSYKVKLIWVAVWVIAYLLAEYMMLSPLIRARIEASGLTEFGMITEAEVFYPGYQTELQYFTFMLYRLSYRFSADDPEGEQAMTFTDRQFVSGDTWDRLIVSGHATVIYLPSDPTVSRLAGNDSDNTDLDDFPLYVALFGPPIAIGLWAGLSWLKEWIDRQNTMP